MSNAVADVIYHVPTANDTASIPTFPTFLIFINMKKQLLSFLPLLLVLFAGISAKAADPIAITVTWDTPGTIEVIKGGNPTLSSAVVMPLEAGQTSFTITSDDSAYWFKGTEGNTLSTTVENAVNGKASITNLYGTTYFKVDPTWSKWQAINNMTFKLNVTPTEYSGSFTLDVANGADAISLEIDGRPLTAVDGLQTFKIIKGESTLNIRSNSYKALFKVTANDVEVEYKNFKYTIPVSNGTKVYVAATDDAAAKCTVSVKFTNNNPDCILSIRDWSLSKFISDFTKPFEVVSGTVLQINPNDNGDYTFNSITANGQPSQFSTKLTITEDTEFIVDATTKTFTALSATLYTNDIDALTFTNSTFDAGAGDITLTKVSDIPAGTVTISGQSVDVATTQYTLGNISGKTKNVFFSIKPGHYLYNGLISHAAADESPVLAGASAFRQENSPVFIDVRKINFDKSVKVFYQGPADKARLCAKFQQGKSVEPATYDGQRPGDYIASGWSEIKIDSDYDSYFEVAFNVGDAEESYQQYVVADGTTYSPNENGVYTGIKLTENSVLQVIFAPVVPKAYTLQFLTAGDAKATLSSGAFSTNDFSKPVTLTGEAEYTLTPEAGTTILVNGVEAPLTAGKYVFTPQAGSTTNIQLVKEGFGTLACSTVPADKATVKSLSQVQLILDFSNFEEGNMADMVSDADAWINVTANGVKQAFTVEAGEGSEKGLPIIIALAEAVTSGTVNVTIPAGVVFETIPNDDFTAYTRTAASRVNPAIDLTVIVDPDYTYKWSFTPEAGSINDTPEDYAYIYLALPEAESLDSTPFKEGCGPWIKYNGNAVYETEDPEETPGWMYTQTMATWGKPIIAIAISPSIFATPGELTITADAGAFTVDGDQPSPALEYAAKFGDVREYAYTLVPESNTEISNWETFTLTFTEAASVALNEDDGYITLNQGNAWAAITVDTEINGNTVILKPVSGSAPLNGSLTLSVGAGTFILDGNQLSPEITATYTFKNDTPVDFTWQASPSGAVVNAGYGVSGAIVFAEGMAVSYGDNFEQIQIKFNDQVLEPVNWSDESVMGYMINVESNMFMAAAMNGELNDSATDGTLAFVIPAGAITVNGVPTPEEITYSWNVVAKKNYTMELTPGNGDSVKELSEITIAFPEAETATLSQYFQNGWIAVYAGYQQAGISTAVEAVEGAAHPAFKVTFNPVTAAGNYKIRIQAGSFLLDGVQESKYTEIAVTVNPTMDGVEGIEAADGLFTVFNLQGILVIKEADAEALKALPAGVYIVNGKKVVLK